MILPKPLHVHCLRDCMIPPDERRDNQRSRSKKKKIRRTEQRPPKPQKRNRREGVVPRVQPNSAANWYAE